MKLKKIMAGILATVAAFATIGFASCGGDSYNGKVKMIDVPLSSESYGVAVNKDNEALLATVNTVISENATEIAAMVNAYIEAGEGATYYVEGVVTYEDSMAANDAYLVMATDAPFAPWEYQVGQNWGGIDIELGAMIA